MTNCLFCSIAQGDAPQSSETVEDLILAESPEFYLKPALGSFVEGYSLIIPKDHYRTFAEIPSEILSDFVELQAKVRKIVSSIYGLPTMIFEHGAACPQNRAGACIDHAHMHIVPFKGGLVAHPDMGAYREVGSLYDISSVTSGRSYLFIEDEFGSRVILCEERVESQFLRRQIASHLGVGDVWDWRKNPFRGEIARFISNFYKACDATNPELSVLCSETFV